MVWHMASTAQAARCGRFLWLLIAAALVAYAFVFVLWVFFGATLEVGVGVDEVGVTRDDIHAFSPGLLHYIDHLHVALGGFMAGLGIALGGLAWFGLRAGQSWSLWVIVAATAVALVVSTPLHYVYGFATVVHIGPLYPGVALGALATWWSWRGLRRPEDGKG